MKKFILIVVGLLISNLAFAQLTNEKITTANEELAQKILQTLSLSAEMYASENKMKFPSRIEDLTNASRPSINENFCDGAEHFGYSFTCIFSTDGYTITANPATLGVTGTKSYTISTGGILK